MGSGQWSAGLKTPGTGLYFFINECQLAWGRKKQTVRGNENWLVNSKGSCQQSGMKKLFYGNMLTRDWHNAAVPHCKKKMLGMSK